MVVDNAVGCGKMRIRHATKSVCHLLHVQISTVRGSWEGVYIYLQFQYLKKK